MERIEEDFNTANDRARKYMDSRDDRRLFRDQSNHTDNAATDIFQGYFVKGSMSVTNENEQYSNFPIDTCTKMHTIENSDATRTTWLNIAQACQH